MGIIDLYPWDAYVCPWGMYTSMIIHYFQTDGRTRPLNNTAFLTPHNTCISHSGYFPDIGL